MKATKSSAQESDSLQLFLFGSPQIVHASISLTATLSRRAQALLFYLAVEKRLHNRSHLASLFWADMPDAQARKNLRNILPELRKHLGNWIEIDYDVVGLRQENNYWSDVDLFIQTFNHEREKTDSATLLKAADLYGGDFLHGFSVASAPFFEEWMTNQRTQLRHQAIDGLYQLARRLLQSQELTLGIATTQRLLKIDILHEAAHRLTMQFLALDGQHAAALAHYQELRRILYDELGVEPDAATQSLYEQILAGSLRATSSAAQPKSAPSTATKYILKNSAKHNLPRQLTSLIGRASEVNTVLAILADPNCHLLTLVGAGGVGKTRLALAVGQQIVDANPAILDELDFSDGIAFAPLADLLISAGENGEDRLSALIASAFRLSLQSSISLKSQLFARLRHKQALLILDNFEHLSAYTDYLVELLHATEQLKIIVTSRRELELQFEIVYEVEGLPVADEVIAAKLGIVQVLENPSLALFVERARAVNRLFVLDAENRAYAERICRGVEGLPLAVELAASQTRSHSCAQIWQALQEQQAQEERAAILSSNLRDLPPRQRSINATLAYSWQLLGNDEAATLAQCSIFHGSFSVQAAEQVTGATPALLEQLRRHSLLRPLTSHASDGQEPKKQQIAARFDLHELVRQFVASQITAADQTLLRRRYVTYYSGLLQGWSLELLQNAQAHAALRAEMENLYRVWDWMFEAHFWSLLEGNISGIAMFYWLSARNSEAETIFARAVRRVRTIKITLCQAPKVEESSLDESMVNRILARLLVEQARFTAQQGRIEEAETLLAAALQFANQLNDDLLNCWGFLCQSLIERKKGNVHQIRNAAQQATILAHSLQRPELEAMGYHDLGIAHGSIGDLDYALRYLQAALQVTQQHNFQFLETSVRTSLGNSYFQAADFGQALANLQISLDLQSPLASDLMRTEAIYLLARVLVAVGQYEKAAESIQELLAISEEIDYLIARPEILTLHGVVLAHLGQLESAYQIFEQIAEMEWMGRVHPALIAAKIWHGRFLATQQRWQVALPISEQALTAAFQLGDPIYIGTAQANLANIYLQQGELARACTQVEEILPSLPTLNTSVDLDPIFVSTVCYHVLQTSQNPAAAVILQQAIAVITERAAKISDLALRQSFLKQVPANRQLLALASTVGRE